MRKRIIALVLAVLMGVGAVPVEAASVDVASESQDVLLDEPAGSGEDVPSDDVLLEKSGAEEEQGDSPKLTSAQEDPGSGTCSHSITYYSLDEVKQLHSPICADCGAGMGAAVPCRWTEGVSYGVGQHGKVCLADPNNYHYADIFPCTYDANGVCTVCKAAKCSHAEEFTNVCESGTEHALFCSVCWVQLTDPVKCDLEAYRSTGVGTHASRCESGKHEVYESCTYENGSCTKCGQKACTHAERVAVGYPVENGWGHDVICASCEAVLESCVACIPNGIYTYAGYGQHSQHCTSGNHGSFFEYCQYKNDVCTICKFQICQHTDSKLTVEQGYDQVWCHKRECTACGDIFGFDACILGENYESLGDGRHGRKCSSGDHYADIQLCVDDGSGKCGGCGAELKKACSHSSKLTIHENGYCWEKCSSCNEEWEKRGYTENKVPAAEGKHNIICSVCEKVLEEGIACTFAGEQPTCAQCGRACSHGQVTYTQTIPDRHNGVCQLCGVETASGQACQFDAGDVCLLCKQPKCTHPNKALTPTEGAGAYHNEYCSDCKKWLGQAADCNISGFQPGETDIHTGACTQCGRQVTEKCSFAEGRCKKCGRDQCPHLNTRLNWDFDSAGYYHFYVCKDCGKTMADSRAYCVKAETAVYVGGNRHEQKCITGEHSIVAEDCRFAEGICTQCGHRRCGHEGVRPNLITESGKFWHERVCLACGEVVEKSALCTLAEKYTNIGSGTHGRECTAGGHFADVQPCTPNAQGICTVCGEVSQENCRHIHRAYYHKDGQCIPYCSDCGETGTGKLLTWKAEPGEAGKHSLVCTQCRLVGQRDVACSYENGECTQCSASCLHPEKKYTAGEGSNHKVLCQICDHSQTEACSYSDTGFCAGCGDTCLHGNVTYRHIDGQGKHNAYCDECGQAVRINEPCIFPESGERKCVGCGFVCQHKEFTYSVLLGDKHKKECTECRMDVVEDCGYISGKCTACKDHCGHHDQEYVHNLQSDTHRVLCKACGLAMAEALPCQYEKGSCTLCKNVCRHETVDYTMEVGQKTHKLTCAACGEVQREDCVYTSGECICGRSCSHEKTVYAYAGKTAGGTGEHKVSCQDCGGELGTEACEYESGKCSQCGNRCDHGLHDAYNAHEPGADGTVLCRVQCWTCGMALDREKQEKVLTMALGSGYHGEICTGCGSVLQEEACRYQQGVCTVCRGRVCKHTDYPVRILHSGESKDSCVEYRLCGNCGEALDPSGTPCTMSDKAEKTLGDCHTYLCRDCGGEGFLESCTYGEDNICLICGDRRSERHDEIAVLAHIKRGDLFFHQMGCTGCGTALAVMTRCENAVMDNEDGTHSTVCLAFAEVLHTEACRYADGFCSICGGAESLAEEMAEEPEKDEPRSRGVNRVTENLESELAQVRGVKLQGAGAAFAGDLLVQTVLRDKLPGMNILKQRQPGMQITSIEAMLDAFEITKTLGNSAEILEKAAGMLGASQTALSRTWEIYSRLEEAGSVRAFVDGLPGEGISGMEGYDLEGFETLLIFNAEANGALQQLMGEDGTLCFTLPLPQMQQDAQVLAVVMQSAAEGAKAEAELAGENGVKISLDTFGTVVLFVRNPQREAG